MKELLKAHHKLNVSAEWVLQAKGSITSAVDYQALASQITPLTTQFLSLICRLIYTCSLSAWCLKNMLDIDLVNNGLTLMK